MYSKYDLNMKETKKNVNSILNLEANKGLEHLLVVTMRSNVTLLPPACCSC